MRAKSAEARRDASSRARARATAIRGELERRGVSPAFAQALSAKLEPFAADLPNGQLEAVLSGAAVAYGVHRRSIEAFRRTAAELDEVQGLLGSFAAELRKLDESVEILAAYAARLRHHTAPPPSRVLH
jgi:hypothetical protein